MWIKRAGERSPTQAGDQNLRCRHDCYPRIALQASRPDCEFHPVADKGAVQPLNVVSQFVSPRPRKRAEARGAKDLHTMLAEREGFEPSMGVLLPYALSRGAPSTTRPSLLSCCVRDVLRYRACLSLWSLVVRRARGARKFTTASPWTTRPSRLSADGYRLAISPIG